MYLSIYLSIYLTDRIGSYQIFSDLISSDLSLSLSLFLFLKNSQSFCFSQVSHSSSSGGSSAFYRTFSEELIALLLRLSHAPRSYQPQATVMRMSSELAAGAGLDDSNHQVGLPSSPLLNPFYIHY